MLELLGIILLFIIVFMLGWVSHHRVVMKEIKDRRDRMETQRFIEKYRNF